MRAARRPARNDHEQFHYGSIGQGLCRCRVGEGLGADLAQRFASGYKVALIARSGEVIGKVSNEIRGAGGVALPIQSDATVESQIASAHEQINHEPGPVEILIFNGGRRPMGRLMETTPEVFEQTWRLHAFGAFLWSGNVRLAFIPM
jgi:NAD(P)-dependent dehydrogenase (short-subunit alcohol dehydrogenase family)